MDDWRSGASLGTLKLRAKILAITRAFFADRGILEVETAALSRSAATDVHLDSISVFFQPTSNSQRFYLQTSPELQMKRLLAMGIGPIYQICKAFRGDPSSPRHNPEFTILEWYRPSFCLTQLMEEVEDFVKVTVGCSEVSKHSYLEVFESVVGLNPHKCSLEELKKVAHTRLDVSSTQLRFSEYLDLLMIELIEPSLPEYCFLYDYPECQAAMAAIENDSHGNQIARRFELYCKGIEIANGYFELTDPIEQRKRLELDNIERSKKGLPEMPIDEKFLAALSTGMPKGSGVALGIDRLLMIIGELEDIDSALTFSIDRV